MTQTLFKTCKRCSQKKKIDCFGWSGYVKKDGSRSSCTYCKNCQNELRVQRKFGVSYEKYEKILKKQNYCCANLGCKSTVPGAPGRTRFYIDHCHETGKIRGLLCHSCNLALGHVQDKVEKLEGLIVYLNDQTTSWGNINGNNCLAEKTLV